MTAAKDENGNPVRPRVAVSDESTDHPETAPTLSNFLSKSPVISNQLVYINHDAVVVIARAEQQAWRS